MLAAVLSRYCTRCVRRHPRSPKDAGERGTALLALLAGAFVIGVAPVLVRFADAGPVTIGFWRLFFSLPLLAILAGRSPGGIGRPSRLAVLAGIAFALDLSFWHNGITNTSVGKATVLGNLTPVVVTAMSWIFLKQRPARLFLLATGLSIGGAWTMALARGLGSVGPNPVLGDALSLAAAFWYALYFMAVSAARRVEGTSRVMFWSALTGSPLLLLAGTLLGEQRYPATTAGWAACVGLGVMHVVGQGAIAWALGRLPAITAAVTVLVQPVVAVVLGWMLFNEIFGVWQGVGAVVALSGVLLAQWAGRGERPIQRSPPTGMDT